MEAVNGSFLDEEWESLNRLFSTEDSDDFSQNFHYNNLFSYQGEIPLSFVPNGENVAAVDESLFLPFNSNFYCVSQESSNTSEFHEANAGNFFHDVNNNISESMDFYNMECQVFPNNNVMEEIIQLRSELCNEVQLCNGDIPRLETEDSCQEMQLKRKYETADIQNQDKEHVRISSEEKMEDNISEHPKKKPRVSRNVPKNKRNTQPRKNKKAIETKNYKEGKNAIGNGQSSSICNSDEDSNASQEPNIGSISESQDLVSLNSTGKARASRGSATDPQSLYARKRRERINERLRILQNLVPNGTKVDISTMLEEAVHYVKFLQLQIKLLSSDDLWMYAPIAYNGMDMGLYQKIMPNLLPHEN